VARRGGVTPTAFDSLFCEFKPFSELTNSGKLLGSPTPVKAAISEKERVLLVHII